MFFYRIKIALLTLGTVGGFAAGAMHLHCHAHRRAAMERHIARVCIDAARADGRGPAGAWAPPAGQPAAPRW
jgi:hypothetical protein